MPNAASSLDDLNAEAMLAELTQCRQPFLIGVRHHSAAMAKVVPQLLDEFEPDVLLLELPPEFEEWLPWLAHSETVAPIALSGCNSDGQQVSFYPFADFSPELAAIRWAAKNGVPIDAFDLPVMDRSNHRNPRTDASRGLLASLMNRTESTDSGQLWERLVESTAAGCTPESIRRSGLMFGWAMRWNDQTPSEYDMAREAYMRLRIAAHKEKKTAAVIGAYHAAALLPAPRLWQQPADLAANSPSPPMRDATFATAMIPYSFQQLDERSGYPAGIRDPLWHQKIFEASSLDDCDAATSDLIVAVCRELRNAGHPMNAADGMEVLRMARDLARLRGLATPGRGELMESLQSCLTRGQLFGLGRAVADAMQTVLVGRRSGSVPTSLPRCGLAPHIDGLFHQLRLPGSDSSSEEKRLRLDPLRSGLDRARVVVFEQLNVCQIPYAKRAEDGSVGHRESLTSVWDVQWQHATVATIALAGTRGATLRQAAEGTLHSSGMEQPTSEWEDAQLSNVMLAAECGFSDLVRKGMNWLLGSFATTASLAKLTQAMHFIDRIRSGHIPGLPSLSDEFLPAICQPFDVVDDFNTTPLLQAAISRVRGLAGSDDEADVAALLDLVLWFQQQPDGLLTLEGGQLLFCLRQFSKSGSPLMQGGALGCRLLMGDVAETDFATQTGSWLDAAVDETLRHNLTRRLRGTLIQIMPRLHSDPGCLDGIEERIDATSDADFLERLPALRGGFDVVNPSTRRLLLRQIQQRLPDDLAARSMAQSSDVDPLIQKLWYEADQEARKAVAELLPDLKWTDDVSLMDYGTSRTFNEDPLRQLHLLDRWRLVLGIRDQSMCQSGRRVARALDELYGRGSGEGSRGDLGGGSGAGGGDEAPWPNTRVWADELGDLFGNRVREEVLGTAVGKGRAGALAVMDEESVRPSVELLQTVLQMKGSLPESQTEKLRRIARRITDDLAKELATRIAPALTGLSTPRPTRRPNRRLDLRRTVVANLKTARVDDEGITRLVPEQFYFRTPSRRTMDWHLIFVVDVSGSMEPSVIYSALTAAIFSALPALSVTFLAFSTEVIDLTNHVEDPLAMLMEVQVGGGTFIWKGLKAARERMKVPSRTIVLLVSDFEEGGSIGAVLNEVQAIVDSGATALGLAALSDDGKPRYHTGIAARVAGCGMPVAALSPLELARWVGEQVR
jgi:Mg-chelatase subunit ChlD